MDEMETRDLEREADTLMVNALRVTDPVLAEIRGEVAMALPTSRVAVSPVRVIVKVSTDVVDASLV